MEKTLLVSAIKKGTVIDHIPAGQALRIIRLLNVAAEKNRITIGLNLPSKSLKQKDIIKIESKVLTEKEANEIILFAPNATINIIENFEVSQKISNQLPSEIKSILVCPNSNCITHGESVSSHFYVEEFGQCVKLTCRYCEKQYDRDLVEEVTL